MLFHLIFWLKLQSLGLIFQFFAWLVSKIRWWIYQSWKNKIRILIFSRWNIKVNKQSLENIVSESIKTQKKLFKLSDKIKFILPFCVVSFCLILLCIQLIKFSENFVLRNKIECKISICFLIIILHLKKIILQ